MPAHDYDRNETTSLKRASDGCAHRARGRRALRLVFMCACAYVTLSCSMIVCSSLLAPGGSRAGNPVDDLNTVQTDPHSEREASAASLHRLRVGNTPIDTLVPQPSENQPSDWYLKHDINGMPYRLGTPYLDSRCRNRRHFVVYGHNHGIYDIAFSSIARAEDDAKFQSIGPASWGKIGDEPQTYLPAFSCRVDRSYAAIQRFSYSSHEEFVSWLDALKEDARACSANCDELIQRAQSALSLITCSYNNRDRRDRTIIVFLQVESDYSAVSEETASPD